MVLLWLLWLREGLCYLPRAEGERAQPLSPEQQATLELAPAAAPRQPRGPARTGSSRRRSAPARARTTAAVVEDANMRQALAAAHRASSTWNRSPSHSDSPQPTPCQQPPPLQSAAGSAAVPIGSATEVDTALRADRSPLPADGCSSRCAPTIDIAHTV